MIPSTTFEGDESHDAEYWYTFGGGEYHDTQYHFCGDESHDTQYHFGGDENVEKTFIPHEIHFGSDNFGGVP